MSAGINCAYSLELIDAQVHVLSLVVVCVRLDFPLFSFDVVDAKQGKDAQIVLLMQSMASKGKMRFSSSSMSLMTHKARMRCSSLISFEHSVFEMLRSL